MCKIREDVGHTLKQDSSNAQPSLGGTAAGVTSPWPSGHLPWTATVYRLNGRCWAALGMSTKPPTSLALGFRR